MRTITTTVYLFPELSPEAKERARDWYRSASNHDEWWLSTYEDAEQSGLKITGFDIGRANSIEGKFTAGALECAHKIEKNHGEHCETFKTTKAFLTERDAIVDNAERDDLGEFEDVAKVDSQLDDCEAEFLRAILEDYRIMLRKEYEYQQPDEFVDELIMANEYEFTVEGKRL